MTSLQVLICDGNHITSLEPLRHSALKELSCAENSLTDLDPIQYMPSLRRLHIPGNKIASLTALTESGLDDVDCSDNPVNDLHPVLVHPPIHLSFDCDSIPDNQLEQAVSAWHATSPANALTARILLLVRNHDRSGLLAQAHDLNGRRVLAMDCSRDRASADRLCRELGGHLVDILSDQDYDAIRAMGPRHHSGNGTWGTSSLWVGLQSRGAQFLASDGTAAHYLGSNIRANPSGSMQSMIYYSTQGFDNHLHIFLEWPRSVHLPFVIAWDP